ncbi:MAG: hypothetical protein GY737_19305 [Desulfobacteraceae bacterium]|nr:hypothetical protein [Desulfobacteraceae bacterium]
MKKSFFIIIIFLFLGVAVSASDFDSSISIATGEAYFDIATGHKYIRNHDGSYTEYNKKGNLFRANLPNTQPHLATSRYIIEITPDSYLCYEKFINNKMVQKFLPFSDKHPKGWKCKKLLMAVKESHESRDIGLGYTKEK